MALNCPIDRSELQALTGHPLVAGETLFRCPTHGGFYISTFGWLWPVPRALYSAPPDGSSQITNAYLNPANALVVTKLDGSTVPIGEATTFISLADTPSSYTTHGGKNVRVKADETGLEFVVAGAPGPHDSTHEAGGSDVVDAGFVRRASDPGSPAVGEVWINAELFKYRDNGTTPATRTVVTTDLSQTLSNKALASPVVGTQITLDQTTADYTVVWNNPGGARTLTIPDPGASDTFTFLSATQTLSNKTLTTPTIANFVNATHTHTDAVGGGDIGAQNYSITGNWDVSGITGRIKIQTGSGAPSHSEAEGTLYWDTVGDALYVNNNGSTGWTNISGGGGAGVGEAFVTIGNSGGLSAERSLTGTANQVIVTDNGANSTVVLSTPQNIHTAANPQFATLGLGTAAIATAGLIIDRPDLSSNFSERALFVSPTTQTISAGVINARVVELTGWTYDAASAQTLTNGMTLVVSPPVAGANVTITNKIGLLLDGTDANLWLGGSAASDDSATNSPDIRLRGFYDATAGTGVSSTKRDIILRNVTEYASATGQYRLDFLDDATNAFVTFEGDTQRVGILTTTPATVLDVAGSGTIKAVSIGPSATQQHSLPAVSSDTFILSAATQTLTNKTLVSPTIQGTVDPGAGLTMPAFAMSGTLSRAGDQTIDLTGSATRTLTIQNSTSSQVANIDVDGRLIFRNNTLFTITLSGTPTAARVFTFPDVADDTVAMLSATQTLSNKTLSAPTIGTTDWANANHAHAATNSGGQIAISDTTGTLAIARGGTGIAANPKVEVVISAASLKGTSTAGAGDANKLPESAETPTNKVNYDYIAFDTTTEENAFFQYSIPKGWDEGTITFRVKWTNTSGQTSETVVWGLKALALSDGDSLDSSWGTEVTVTDTWIAQNAVHITPESSALTIGGTPAEGDNVIFNIARKTASDNLTGDARLMEVILTFTRNSYSD